MKIYKPSFCKFIFFTKPITVKLTNGETGVFFLDKYLDIGR